MLLVCARLYACEAGQPGQERCSDYCCLCGDAGCGEEAELVFYLREPRLHRAAASCYTPWVVGLARGHGQGGVPLRDPQGRTPFYAGRWDHCLRFFARILALACELHDRTRRACHQSHSACRLEQAAQDPTCCCLGHWRACCTCPWPEC
jgi:hypothetical protein